LGGCGVGGFFFFLGGGSVGGGGFFRGGGLGSDLRVTSSEHDHELRSLFGGACLMSAEPHLQVYRDRPRGCRERGGRTLLVALGRRPRGRGMRATPRRVAKAYAAAAHAKPFKPDHVPQRRGLRRARCGERTFPFTRLHAHMLTFHASTTWPICWRAHHSACPSSPASRSVRARPAGAGTPHMPGGDYWLQDHLAAEGRGLVIEADEPLQVHCAGCRAGRSHGHLRAPAWPRPRGLPAPPG